ncbi:isochorismatase family protein [Colwellia sp. MB02u-6]|uniref:isochorismatase family protein n=1 Tax=Colwellia sp. MB02u-6 TaxID=2759824 RepID=UPI0015F45AB4|nr:isochorismatase family protein [Colwellia sp. MB02u-6]MBA6327558.1 isochorismatase family protein [Colwellia sp. MB02u-6]
MLKKESTGLIVTDVQGKLAHMVYDSEVLISNCGKLIKGAQALGLPIIWLEQNPAKLGATVTELSALLAEQTPTLKFTFDACETPLFIEQVKVANIEHWLICGIEAHICVYQTALHLQQLGYKVQLVSDCVSSRALANKHLAINKLNNRGIDISGLEMCLYELVKDCRADEFKEILALIR